MQTLEMVNQGANVPNHCLGEHQDNDDLVAEWEGNLALGFNPPDLIIVRGNFGGHNDLRLPENHLKLNDIFLRIRKFQVGAKSPNGFVFRFCSCRDADEVGPGSGPVYPHYV